MNPDGRNICSRHDLGTIFFIGKFGSTFIAEAAVSHRTE